MKAGRGASGTRYAKMAHVVCDIVAEGGKVSPEDMELIEQEIMPREVIMRQYGLYKDSMHPAVSAGHGEKYLHTGLFETWETGRKYGFAWTLSDRGGGRSQKTVLFRSGGQSRAGGKDSSPEQPDGMESARIIQYPENAATLAVLRLRSRFPGVWNTEEKILPDSLCTVLLSSSGDQRCGYDL